MERRAFLSALLGGIGVSFVASQVQALPRLAPQEIMDPAAPAPQFGVATPEDLEKTKVEKSYYRWRRRYWRRRYWRRPYWRRRYWRRYWW